MPCYYTGSAEGDAKLAYQEATEALTEVTSLLCELCAYVEAGGGRGTLPERVQEWWEKHQRIDAKRKREEWTRLQQQIFDNEKQRQRRRLELLAELDALDEQ